MRVNITFRHMEGTEAIKEHVTKKVERARKFLQGPCEANVVMSVERHLHRCDVTVTAGRLAFKGAEETEDMYTSVDKVMDKIERQIRRSKEREQDRKGLESIREADVADVADEPLEVLVKTEGDVKETADES